MAIRVVKTRFGVIEGLPAEDQAVSVFKGIPYAEPPIGYNRWRLPKQCKPWNGVFKAYSFAPMSMQPRVKADSFYAKEYYPDLTLPQDESGLFLNIWTPANSGNEKLPVAIWIHGGAYVNGYAHKMEYNGTEFAKRGIVFVSINYRLNVFGFFAHPELTSESEYHGSGNWGFYDQRFAIQWVKENISEFGGNPDLITIMGQSAGGGSVLTQCLSPLNKGAFNRAIMQSCAALTDSFSWGAISLEEAEAIGKEFFNYAGIKDVSCGRQIEAKALMNEWLSFCQHRKMKMAAVRNIDHYLIPATENELLLKGEFAKIDYLIGCNKDEHMGDRVSTMSVEDLRSELCAQVSSQEADRIIKEFSICDEQSAAQIHNQLWGSSMVAFSSNFCRLLCKMGHTPGYQYWFTQQPPGKDQPGVFHSAEYCMMYKTLRFSWRPYTGADYEFSDVFNRYWANFIKTGNPNGIDQFGNALPEWSAYTLDKPFAMNLNSFGGMCVPGYPIDQYFVAYTSKKYSI